jgi:D-glycero-alpha-D-manno-heptose-7-phosphate kinase
MLIARAPLRISLAGGGTDLPAYYEQFGGMVVSTTIDRFVYVQVQKNGVRSAQITSADYRTFYRHQWGAPMTWSGELALPRAVLHEFGIERGVSVFTASEAPPGTGLGSSSALAIALIQAIAAYTGRMLSRQEIADLACHIELNKLAAPIGKQDQFAAAFGGMNAISFAREGVDVRPIRATPATLATLERRLMLFFTGTSRDSAAILREQGRATSQHNGTTLHNLHRIREAAEQCCAYLESGDVDGIGRLLDSGWRYKRELTTGITNGRIDECYEVALANGALGGKITGAGGGGFLLIYCQEVYQEQVTNALENLGLRRMDFHFEPAGVTVSAVDWQTVTADQDDRLVAAV